MISRGFTNFFGESTNAAARISYEAGPLRWAGTSAAYAKISHSKSVVYLFTCSPTSHSQMVSWATGENRGFISPFISVHSVLAG